MTKLSQHILIAARRRLQVHDQHGVTLITFAIMMPVLVTVFFAAFDLFMIARASSIAQRAALEGARAMNAAAPGDAGQFSYYSHGVVSNKETYNSVTGGDTESNVYNSYIDHGKLWKTYASTIANGVKLPFNPGQIEGGGPWYAPRTQAAPMNENILCLETVNETSHNFDTGCTNTGWVTNQLPHLPDFDGDGRTDIAFYRPMWGTTGPDFYILPSSSGMLLRNAIIYEGGVGGPGINGKMYPCWADYDGDGITDLCRASMVHSTGAHSIMIFMSSNNFNYSEFTWMNFSFTPTTRRFYVVPGRWDSGHTKDQFAVITIGDDTAPYVNDYALHIWPVAVSNLEVREHQKWTIANTPTRYSSGKFKPTGGRIARPVTQDVDGDGDIDLGYLEWPGGNKVHKIGGTSTLGYESGYTSPIDAYTADMVPFRLFYPDSTSSCSALYVVERYAHRISLITNGSDGQTNAEERSTQVENYTLVAGQKTFTGSMKTDFPSPDPVGYGVLDAGTVPQNTNDDGCTTCAAGGNYNGHAITDPTTLHLNSPRDVWTTGALNSDLFVADYGNYRVRKISPGGTDSCVNGTSDETVITVAGGRVGEGNGDASYCMTPTSKPALVNGNEPYLISDFPILTVATTGIHPNCVKIRPISLTADFSGARDILFIGDEAGFVYMLDPGADNVFNMGSDEVLRAIIGAWTGHALTAPPIGIWSFGHGIGMPQSIQILNSANWGNMLFVATRHFGLPVAGNSTTTTHAAVLVINDGNDNTWGTVDDLNVSRFGTFVQQNYPPGLTGNITQINLKNITDMVVLDGGDSTEYLVYVTGWWSDLTNNTGHENSLILFTIDPDDPLFHWVNGPQNSDWGARVANQPWGPYNFNYDERIPITTLPVEPAGGLTISPDEKYLYFSQTSRGSIFAMERDQDGDGTLDSADTDIDGDGTIDTTEYTNDTNAYIASNGTWGERTMDYYNGARMWFVDTADDGMDAAGTPVDMLEYVLDRFGKTVNAATPVPADEEAPYALLNDETVAVAAPMGALHGSPVWSGGFTRDTEMNGSTPRLAPIIMGSPTPMANTVKDVSGHLDCTDWKMNQIDSSAGAFGLLNTGYPSTVCDRKINLVIPGTTLKTGIRRAHLAHWNNQWHRFSSSSTANLDDNWHARLQFIDFDGDGATNPALFMARWVWGDEPYMVHIGNMPNASGSTDPCPGSWSISDLTDLRTALQTELTTVSVTLSSDEYQYRCETDEFFTPTGENTNIASILVSHRAEWATTTKQTLNNYPQVFSARLDLGVEGDGDPNGTIGFVPQMAYTVLEESLRVDRRENDTQAYDAEITFKADTASAQGIRVKYVLPLSPIMAAIYGSSTITIERFAVGHLYSEGVND